MKIRVTPAFDVASGTWFAHEVHPPGTIIAEAETLAQFKAALPKNATMVGCALRGADAIVVTNIPSPMRSPMVLEAEAQQMNRVPSVVSSPFKTDYRKRKRGRLPQHDHERVIALYQSNVTADKIAQQLGMKHEQVSYVLQNRRKAGDQRARIASMARSPSQCSVPWNDERIAEMLCMHSAGISTRQIAAQLGGTSKGAVAGKLHRLQKQSMKMRELAPAVS